MTSVALRARLSTTTGVSNLHSRLAESKQSQEKDQVGLERSAQSILGLEGFDSWVPASGDIACALWFQQHSNIQFLGHAVCL